MQAHRSAGSKAFDIINYTFISLIALVMAFPLCYVLLGSLSSSGLVNGFNQFTLDGYRFIFSTSTLARSAINSVIITLVGTGINVLMTVLTAYPLSKKQMRGRKGMLLVVMICMLFQPGIIPNFILVDGLRLTNTYLALWLPGAIGAYYLIIMKNNFQTMPDSIEESASIDGCNDLQTFVHIVLPLSKATLAAIALFYAVAHWNNYFNAMIYIRDAKLWPIQVWLRQIVILSLGGFSNTENLSEFASVPKDSVRYGVIIVSTLPILAVYPFLQKHFAKGVLLGSVKG